jgi:hypothetical protein
MKRNGLAVFNGVCTNLFEAGKCTNARLECYLSAMLGDPVQGLVPMESKFSCGVASRIRVECAVRGWVSAGLINNGDHNIALPPLTLITSPLT